MIHRSPEFEEMENGRSESNDKMEMFRQHQEGLRIHVKSIVFILILLIWMDKSMGVAR